MYKEYNCGNMINRKKKNPNESKVETRYLLMPQDLNHHGTAFGGTIMSWIDTTAAMTAQKHAETDVVTASIDSISFYSPAVLGDHIVIKSSITYVGKTSMEIEVIVVKENPYTSEEYITTKAFLTFVAVNEEGKPVEVPDLILRTSSEIEKYTQAKNRVIKRKENRNKEI
jgi:acyl-CoA hydrolase